MKKFLLSIIVCILFAVNLSAQGLNHTALRTSYSQIIMSGGGWIGPTQAGGWNFTSDPYIYTETSDVGIGIAIPLFPLHIYGTAASAPEIRITNDGTYTMGMGILATNVAFLGSANATPFAIRVNGANRMYLTTTGFIGVATSVPEHLFDIGGKGDLVLTGIDVGTDSTVIDSNSVTVIDASSNTLFLGADSISKNADFVVKQNGNVGIGTSTPATALDISGNITLADDNWIGMGAADGRVVFDDQAIDEIGIMAAKVGIGTVSPSEFFHITNSTDGVVRALMDNTSSGTSAQAGWKISAVGTSGILAAYASTFDIIAHWADDVTLFADTDASGLNIAALAAAPIEFYTGGYTTASRRFIINTVGSVGTPNKAATLGVGVTTFAVTSNVMTITGDGGANTVGTITGATDGAILTLIFVDAFVTITDTDAHTANTVDLIGTATNMTGADDKVLMLVYDGTSWYQTAPVSAN